MKYFYFKTFFYLAFLRLEILFFVVVLFVFPFLVLAENQVENQTESQVENWIQNQTENSNMCRNEGYTVITINGIFTNESEAQENRNALRKILPDYFKDEDLLVDYLYNPSHIAGIGDIFDVAYQKHFDTETVRDYDLIEMLNSASRKITTQKILLVGHSQGNFYANSFYNEVVDKISEKSIGVYGVATPSMKVAGGGNYITSSKDKVINFLRVKNILNILPANADINFTDASNGHSFADVYLKNAGKRIASEIKSSLAKLSSNEIQDKNKACFAYTDPTLGHKILRNVLHVVDPVAFSTLTILKTASASAEYVSDHFANAVILFSSALNDATDRITDNLFNNNAKKGNVATALVGYDQINSADSISKDESKEPKITNENISPSKPINSFGSNYPPQPVYSPESINPDLEFSNKQIKYSGSVSGSSDDEKETKTKDSSEEKDEDTEEDPKEEPETPPVCLNKDTDTTPPEITILGDNPTIIQKDVEYSDKGAEAHDDLDTKAKIEVTNLENVDTSIPGTYHVTYIATDCSGNSISKDREVKVSSYVYIPKYSFGLDDEGRDWQMWHFNGSQIFDWSDTYVDGYLKEEFKIKTEGPGIYCFSCLERGIFNHDPQKGFESSDVTLSLFEENPQNKMDNKIYQVSIQWDAKGYDFNISKDGVMETSGRTNISENLTIKDGIKNLWVGWDGSNNHFKNFSSGNWTDRGGYDMFVKPYKIYNGDLVQ